MNGGGVFEIEPSPSAACFALCDCNNFYASCETVFRPQLEGKPVVVLSNNDGCVIARSAAAKAVGVKMGQPAHEIAFLVKTHGITVCSGNFALYGDISARVMDVLGRNAPRLDVYSIDEAFLDLSVIPQRERAQYAVMVRNTVRQWTGIPVSIGIASTKTLAKAANDWAKKRHDGVLELWSQARIEWALRGMAVDDIWGIGAHRGEWLRRHRIYSAYDFACAENAWVRRHLSVTVARTQLELRGVSCLPLVEAPEARRQIMSSRSFGRPVSALSELKEAVAQYVTRAAEKLRAQRCVARVVTVFITTNPFRATERQYHKSATLTLTCATCVTPELVGAAHRLLERIYRDGYQYHKAGVLLSDLSSKDVTQADLFAVAPDPRRERLMDVMDAINQRFGRDVIHLLSMGNAHAWRMKQAYLSPRYTTRWSELARAR